MPQQLMEEYLESGSLVFASRLDTLSRVKDFVGATTGLEAWPAQKFNSSHHKGSADKMMEFYKGRTRLAAEK